MADARRLQAGNDERGLGVERQDEHGEPFERHRFVPDRPRQIRAERQKQGFDLLFGHGRTDLGQPDAAGQRGRIGEAHLAKPTRRAGALVARPVHRWDTHVARPVRPGYPAAAASAPWRA